MDILDESLTEIKEKELVLAGKGARFAHYVIDTIAFYLLFFIMAFIFGDLLAIPIDEDSGGFGLIYFGLFVMFFAIFEYQFGKSPGKFLTRTSVVKEDGSRPTFLNILGRSAARLIPFDGLSYLFVERGWHDQISRTYVVKD